MEQSLASTSSLTAYFFYFSNGPRTAASSLHLTTPRLAIRRWLPRQPRCCTQHQAMPRPPHRPAQDTPSTCTRQLTASTTRCSSLPRPTTSEAGSVSVALTRSSDLPRQLDFFVLYYSTSVLSTVSRYASHPCPIRPYSVHNTTSAYGLCRAPISTNSTSLSYICLWTASL